LRKMSKPTKDSIAYSEFPSRHSEEKSHYSSAERPMTFSHRAFKVVRRLILICGNKWPLEDVKSLEMPTISLIVYQHFDLEWPNEAEAMLVENTALVLKCLDSAILSGLLQHQSARNQKLNTLRVHILHPHYAKLPSRSTWHERGDCIPILRIAHLFRIFQLHIFVFCPCTRATIRSVDAGIQDILPSAMTLHFRLNRNQRGSFKIAPQFLPSCVIPIPYPSASRRRLLSL
jgi:hypothetical protein